MGNSDRFVIPYAYQYDANGVPEAGAKLNFYEVGTTTRKDTFSDSALTTPNANPVVADANGRFGDIFTSGVYKIVMTDADDVEIWTADPWTKDISADVISESTAGAGVTVDGVLLKDGGVTLTSDMIASSNKITGLADGTASADAVNLSQVTNKNYLINGDFRIAQRGTTFTAATTPANSDDTYLLDRWILLSDGNDIADVSQETTIVPTGAYSACKLDIATANKKFGLLQVLEAKDVAKLVGGTASLSFDAEKVVGNATLNTLRSAIISWDSTEDVVTSDVVSAWNGAGTDPTLVANWTYENTPSNLTLTDAYQTFTIEGVAIDTASTKNVAVFIWVDDVDATVGDLAYITNVKLEEGSVATDFVPSSIGDELAVCQRYFTILGRPLYARATSTTLLTVQGSLPVEMRTTPTISAVSVNQTFNMAGGGTNATSSFGIVGSAFDANGGRVDTNGWTALDTARFGNMNSDTINCDSEL